MSEPAETSTEGLRRLECSAHPGSGEERPHSRHGDLPHEARREEGGLLSRRGVARGPPGSAGRTAAECGAHPGSRWAGGRFSPRAGVRSRRPTAPARGRPSPAAAEPGPPRAAPAPRGPRGGRPAPGRSRGRPPWARRRAGPLGGTDTGGQAARGGLGAGPRRLRLAPPPRRVRRRPSAPGRQAAGAPDRRRRWRRQPRVTCASGHRPGDPRSGIRAARGRARLRAGDTAMGQTAVVRRSGRARPLVHADAPRAGGGAPERRAGRRPGPSGLRPQSGAAS